MIKKIFILITILFFTGCGYESIYINKNNSVIKISNINTNGDDQINKKIISMTGLSLTKDISNSYSLIIKSKKEKVVAAKNSSGDVTAYKMLLNIKISLADPLNNKIIKSKEFNSSFIYNNADNKFQLSQDEKNIINNLIETVSGKILIYLNS
tara:strand:- start:1376 stop:1834 length:459 start_codon:yes stop_codon:yes gene_type:complete